MIRYFVVLLALLVGCVPSKSAPDGATSDAGAPDASVTHEPEHFGAAAPVLTPLSYLQPPGTAGRKMIVSEDGGTWIAVDANVGGGGGSVTGVDGGGIACDGSACFISPACDGGFIVHFGGKWICEGVPFAPTLIAQDDASAGQDLTWNGSRWAPTTPAPVAIDAGTTGQLPEARLVSCSQYAPVVGGASTNQCGTINLASTVAVGTSKLPEISGGTGADLSSCTAGEPILAASGTFQCVSTLPVASGGTGAAMSCSSAQLPVAQSSLALQCESLSGDCTMTSAGVITCPSANASGAGALSFGSTTGTITAASTATAPGLAQASESTTQTPTFMALAPQVSTHSTNQDSSGLNIDLSSPLGTAVDAYTCQYRNGVAEWCMGAFPGGIGQALYFGIDRSAITTLNPTFLSYAFGVYLNAQSGGTVHLRAAGVDYANITPADSEFAGNAALGTVTGTAVYGGGTNTLQFLNGTAPTGACTGGTCVGSNSSDGFYVLPTGSSAIAFEVGPLGGGVGVEEITTATQPSGSNTGGPIVSGYQGQLFGWGEQSTSLPQTETLLAPAYTGTLNTTAMTGGGTTAQAITELKDVHVCSFAASTSGTCAAQLDAIPDSIVEGAKARIVCTVMTANTGETVGEAVQAESTALVSLPHGTSTVTVLGTPVYSVAAMGSSGLTATAVWTASGTSPTVTWTLGSANLVGANKCTVFSGEFLN